MAIVDDNYDYVMGHLAVIFPASDAFAEDLKEIGLKLQPAKSKCYIDKAHQDDSWNPLRGSIPNGTITDADGNEHHGISVYNVPIGYRENIREYLHQKRGNILKGYHKISTLMDPGR